MKIIIVISVIALSFFIYDINQEWFWSSDEERARSSQLKNDCLEVHDEFQNAFQCLAYPDSWQRWSELHKIYDSKNDEKEEIGVVGCPIFIQKLEKYNLTHDERQMFIFLTKIDIDAGLIYKYKKLEGVDFCDAAVMNGWYEHYLENQAD